MAVVLEKPEEPRREPVVVIAVRDDGRCRRDPILCKQLLELALLDEVPDRMLLQVRPPVESDRTRDVTLVIRGGVDIHLERADVGVLGMVGEPICLDEHVFGIGSHRSPP